MKSGSNDVLSGDDSNPYSYQPSPNYHPILSPTSSLNNNTSQQPTSSEAQKAIARIEEKIRQIKESMKHEQGRCNENVNEYLKLSSNIADPTQVVRVKSAFEKNNQKSAQKISRYQKKLKHYEQELINVKEHGIINRHTRERLRDVRTNIKEGISGLSGGVLEGIKSGIHTAGE